MALARRSLLQAAASGAMLIGNAFAGSVPSADISLREAAKRVGLSFGSESDVGIAAQSPEYAALFVDHCDLLAPQMSWARMSPLQYDPMPAWEDPNVRFAMAHGMRLTGGHLLWHENLPAWFAQLRSRHEAEQAAQRHIDATTRRYRNSIYSWNVVNEGIEPKDERSDGLRASPLLQQLGPDYITTAFQMARIAAPDVTLVYNEYGLEMDRRDHEARRTALLKLLARLQSARAPIDAVGIQSHLRLDGSRFDGRRFQSFLNEISGRKLSIIISELDVFDGDSTSDLATRDAEVAALYSEFLSTAIANPAVVAVITWGLADRYSWLNTRTDLNRIGPGGRLPRPLLFDTSLRPKPAFYAALTAFNHASRRQTL